MQYFPANYTNLNISPISKLTSDDLVHMMPLNDIAAMTALKAKYGGIKYMVIVGIGGSSIGTKAFYQALLGYSDMFLPERYPKLIFLETESDRLNSQIIQFLSEKSPSDVLINIISKSGTTVETRYNMELILQKLPQFKSQMVVTTNQNSQLMKVAESLGMATLGIPIDLSGRYSVFSCVGMFPLFMCGININELTHLLSQDNLELPMHAAVTKYAAYQTNIFINNLFIFEPTLSELGNWYAQLVAESTGKDKKGILPTTSIGSNDMHSLAQLYLGGKNENLFFTFLSCKTDKHLAEILSAVKNTFTEKGLPFDEFVLDEISASELTRFMWFKMIETVFLAKLMGVNPFNQPNVEDYKKHFAKN